MLSFAGIKFKTPFVVASSPLTAKVEFLKMAEKAGAAGASTKLTFIKQPFYGKLRMYNDPRVGSIVCHDRRLDLEEGVRLVEEAKQSTSLVIFTNITYEGKDLEGWARLARAMEEAGADFIEANLICPNLGLTAKRLGERAVSGGALAGRNPEEAREITRTLKQAVDIPVICKLTPNVTDITEVALACQEGGADGRRRAQLIPLVDHASKLALGCAVGECAVTGLALEAWEQARQTLKTQGVDLKEVIVHHDQDPVFTSYGWTSHLLLRDHVRVSYALNGARDNPQMESFIGRFSIQDPEIVGSGKTENRSLLLDARTLEELQAVVAERMDYYNNRRRHSTIGYQAPIMYIESLQPWP